MWRKIVKWIVMWSGSGTQTQLAVATSKQIALGRASLTCGIAWNGRKVVFQTSDEVSFTRQLDNPITTWLSILYCQTYAASRHLLVLQPNRAIRFFELRGFPQFFFPKPPALAVKLWNPWKAQISGCLKIIHLFQGVAFAQQWSSAAAFGSLERDRKMKRWVMWMCFGNL